MKATINADFPIEIDGENDALGVLVDFESKFTQAMNIAQDIETEHNMRVRFETTTDGDETVINVNFSKVN